ncbi:hypothetical protein BB558_003641 [Smittium angustum]|uniref:Uncharacterized protein n=1 Tax=Smittium angustum TaxID=133377 RepID=A0A2U1J5I3_SMIAN|nr:hypothetical protein BB558_003641 [Smittium angustum]
MNKEGVSLLANIGSQIGVSASIAEGLAGGLTQVVATNMLRRPSSNISKDIDINDPFFVDSPYENMK